MNSRQLIEAGAHVALSAAGWLDSRRPVPRRALHEYWAASKCRHLRWLSAIQAFSVQTLTGSHSELVAWEGVGHHLEEVLASEVLARTWAAAAKAHDELQGEVEVAPIANSALIGHLEARNRVLHLLSLGQQFAVPNTSQLNALRQKTERWCDLLLSHLALRTDVSELAFDAARCRDFADDLRDAPAHDAALAKELILASLNQSFRYAVSERAPNADLNAQISATVMTCIGKELPHMTSKALDSSWLERLSRNADETEGLIEELLS